MEDKNRKVIFVFGKLNIITDLNRSFRSFVEVEPKSDKNFQKNRKKDGIKHKQYFIAVSVSDRERPRDGANK